MLNWVQLYTAKTRASGKLFHLCAVIVPMRIWGQITPKPAGIGLAHGQHFRIGLPVLARRPEVRHHPTGDADPVHLGNEIAIMLKPAEEFGHAGVVHVAVHHKFSGQRRAAARGLRHQHAQPARAGDAQSVRVLQERGARGIVDHVRHGAQARKAPDVDGPRAVVGEHAHGRGVHDHLGVRVQGIHVFIIHRAPARNHDAVARAQGAQRVAGGVAGAAGAEHQRLFAPHIDAFQHGTKAVNVRVVAPERAGRVEIQRVHRAHLARGVRERVHIGNHGLLIGDGHIQPGEIARAQEIAQRVRRDFFQHVIRVAQRPVHLAGIAVPELFANQSVLHTLILPRNCPGRQTGSPCSPVPPAGKALRDWRRRPPHQNRT